MPDSQTSPRKFLSLAAIAGVPLGVGLLLRLLHLPADLSTWVVAAVGSGVALAFFRRDQRRNRRLRSIEAAAALIADVSLGASDADRVLPPSDLGEFQGLQARLTDVQRRVSVYLKEVAKKSRNLESLIDALDEPVLATDSNDKVLLCNRSAETLLNTGSPGSLVGRPVTDIFTQAPILQMHADAHAGNVRRGKIRLTTPVGVRTFQISAAPVPAAWGQGIFGVVLVLRDVTELDQAASVKTDFVANASHELRTPVAAIRGAAETLQQCLEEDPASAGRFVKMIASHAARLEEMLRDLLDLSRLESPDAPIDTREVDLIGLENSLRQQFEALCAPKHLSLSFEFEDRLIGLHTDPKLLAVILRNLIENAVKFAFEGTTVRIVGGLAPGSDASAPKAALRRPARAEGGAEAVSINDKRPAGASGMSVSGSGVSGGAVPAGGDTAGDPALEGLSSPRMARFEVMDRGLGIPLAHQDRVFERYFQVDSARTGISAKRGTGLGLSIVKHAAKALGGNVGLSSVWNEGTTVWLEIPVRFAKAQGPSVAERRRA